MAIMLIGLLISSFMLLAIFLFITKSTFFKLEGFPSVNFLVIFIIKLLAMTFLWWIYTYYYTDSSKADIYKYFNDAKEIKVAIGTNWKLLIDVLNPWNKPSETYTLALKNTMHWDQSSTFLFNDNRSMIRLNLIMLYISNGFFHLHALFFTFCSFLGSVALFRFFQKTTKVATSALVVGVFLIPSSLLWTSSILKESWLFFNLGFFLYFLEKLLRHKNIKFLCYTFCFLILLIGIKTYVFIALIPAFVFLIFNFFSKISMVKNFFLSHVLFFALLLIFKGENLLLKLQVKLLDINQVAITENAGSYFEMKLYHNWIDFFTQLPKGLYNVFVRPIFPPQVNLLSLLSSIEGAFLLALPLLLVFYFKKVKSKQLLIALLCISFVLCLATIVGMTTNVLGAIVRYKVPLLPFYFVSLLTFVEHNKVPYLKKLK